MEKGEEKVTLIYEIVCRSVKQTRLDEHSSWIAKKRKKVINLCTIINITVIALSSGRWKPMQNTSTAKCVSGGHNHKCLWIAIIKSNIILHWCSNNLACLMWFYVAHEPFNLSATQSICSHIVCMTIDFVKWRSFINFCFLLCVLFPSAALSSVDFNWWTKGLQLKVSLSDA